MAKAKAIRWFKKRKLLTCITLAIILTVVLIVYISCWNPFKPSENILSKSDRSTIVLDTLPPSDVPSDPEKRATVKTLSKSDTTILASPSSPGLYSYPEKMREYPFMAYLYIVTINGSDNCGGTVIGKKHILTAAHCLHGATNIAAILGTDNLRFKQKSALTLETGTFTIHEKFDYETYDNDIGLIYFDRSIPNTDNIDMVALAAYQQFNNNNNLPTVVLGWGDVNFKEGLHDELQVKVVKIIDKIECSLYYEDNSKFCAIGNEGPCYGDSGGPLLLGNTQIGILSGGDPNCNTSQPKIYTNVTHYSQWIAEKTP